MRVYFLRHGIAVDREEFSGKDQDRPLTSDGKEKMVREAKALAQLKVKPDAIVASPLLRAKQTAEIAAKEIGGKVIEDTRAGEDFNAGQLAAILEDHEDCDAVMIVGHEPSMSATIGRIIGGANVDLKKGGIACVEMGEPLDTAAVLLWLATPKLLVH